MLRHLSSKTPTILVSVSSVLLAVVTRASASPDDVFDGDHSHYNNRPDAGLFEPGPAYDESGSQYESGLRKRTEEHGSDKFSPELIFAIVLACVLGVLFLAAVPLIAVRRHRQRQHQQRLTSTAAQVLGRNRSLSNGTMRIPQGRQPLTVFIDVDTHIATNSMIGAGSEKLGSPLVAMLKSPFTKKGPRPTSSFLLPFEDEKPRRGTRLHTVRSPSVSPRAWSPPRPTKGEDIYKIELDFDGDVTEQEQDLHRHTQRDRDEKPVLRLTIDPPPSPPSLSLSIPSRPPLSIPTSAIKPIETPVTDIETPTTAISLRAPSPGPAMTPISPVAETLSVARAIGIASATARRFTYTEVTVAAAPPVVLPLAPTLRQPTLPTPRLTANRNSRSLARDVVERNMFVRAHASKSSEGDDEPVEALGLSHSVLTSLPDGPKPGTISGEARVPSPINFSPSVVAADHDIGIAY